MLEDLVAVGLTRELGALSIGVRVGVVLGGHVDAMTTRHTIEPGVVVATSLDWRVLSAPVDPISLTLGLQLGVSHATVRGGGRSDPWTALDLRASVTASRSFGIVTPYLSTRLFGGPVFWRGAMGGDTKHVQLAAGLGVELARGWTLHLEGAVLAERGVFGGLGVSF